MVTLMTITATFSDTSSLTLTESHEMTVEIAKFLTDFLSARKDAGVITTLTVDFSAADTLTVTVV